ncbi:MAG: M67 family metallopeptidase [Ardenticatenaceae bacterium]|nr:M67 family metallopeptidase [Anaerolineales bacterium]MCB8974061.1 M67 family metallopeptidase [Ardenticatenaceae bacterium]
MFTILRSVPGTFTTMFVIERPFLNQILNHLQDCYPEEGCGLVAGDEMGRVTAVYPIENSLRSPTAFQMNPQQQLQTMLALEANGWQLLAIYHSHPHGPETPSVTDVQQAYYPDALSMIVSLANQVTPTVRLFQIAKSIVIEKKIKVV